MPFFSRVKDAMKTAVHHAKLKLLQKALDLRSPLLLKLVGIDQALWYWMASNIPKERQAESLRLLVQLGANIHAPQDYSCPISKAA